MNDGNAMSNGSANADTDVGPMLSRCTTPARVGSARAAKTSVGAGTVP